MSTTYKVAVVGATGVVGREMMNVLEERTFPVSELVPLASPRTAGEKITFQDKEYTVGVACAEAFEGVDIALFSAGGSASLELAPLAAEKGAVVIDNSSAWRMDPEVPESSIFGGFFLLFSPFLASGSPGVVCCPPSTRRCSCWLRPGTPLASQPSA